MIYTYVLIYFLDIDECLLGTDLCDGINADCNDTDGSYTCTCHIGFTGDGETCCMLYIPHRDACILSSPNEL